MAIDTNKIQTVTTPPIWHPDDENTGNYHEYLDFMDVNYPDLDTTEYYTNRVEVNKPQIKIDMDKQNKIDGSTAVTNVLSSMNPHTPAAIKDNALAEQNINHKADQEEMLADLDVAKEVGAQQEANNAIRPVQVGDWNVDKERHVTEDDMFSVDEEVEIPSWQVTANIQGLKHIQLEHRDVAHPSGVTVGKDTFNRFDEVKQLDPTNKDKQTQLAIGKQIFGFAKDQFHVKQNRLNIEYHEAFNAKETNRAKDILGKLNLNAKIADTKLQKIDAMYALDSFMDSNTPAANQKFFLQKKREDYTVIRDGIAATESMVEDYSDQLSQDKVFGWGELTPGTAEYKEVYEKHKQAVVTLNNLQNRYTDIQEGTWNASIVYGNAVDNITNKMLVDIPETSMDLLAAVGSGLTEGAVNNTWELITDVTSSIQGLPNDDPWRLEPNTGNREGVLYNLTSVMTEYMTPVFAARGFMTKANEVVKDISSLFVAGLWMKPEQGNIIHVINEFSDDQLNWLADMGVSPDENDPMFKQISMSIVEGTEEFAIALADLDITPKKGDPAYTKLLQRLSGATQEGTLGVVWHTAVAMNRLGMTEMYHAVKTQKKYATLADRAIESVTGVNIFAKRVNRLRSSAELYADQGMSAQSIFKRTGYHKELDGNWHFRGDYTKGKWNNPGNGSWSLGQILDDKTLYGFVPEAKGTNVDFQSARTPGSVDAEYRPDTNTIVVYADDFSSKTVKSKIWHEIQHNVDHIQGFEGGAEPADFYKGLNKIYSNYSSSITQARKGTNKAEQRVIKKIQEGKPLNKADQKALDAIDANVAAIQKERDALLDTKGRPQNVNSWGSAADTSQYSRTALHLKMNVAGEKRAKWIEDSWDMKFNDIDVVDYPFSLADPMNNTVYLRDWAVTPGSQQKAEAGYVLEGITAKLKAKGLTPNDVPANDKEAYALLESENEHSTTLVNKLVTDRLAVDKENLAVIDIIKNIKPTKITEMDGSESLVYTIMHGDKEAYKAVVKLSDSGATVTMNPVRGFNEVSIDDILKVSNEKRAVNISRQLSTDEAEALVAELSLKPLKVQQQLLSAQIGQTKNSTQKMVLINRVKDINAEIKSNKVNLPKVSMLEDLKTVEWNNQIYSKLENFVNSLPDNKTFKSREDIIVAAQKYGVTKEEIQASRFYAGDGWKSDSTYTKGMLQMQVEGRKDAITYRSWKGSSIKDNPADLHIETYPRDQYQYVENLDTGTVIRLNPDYDSGMYVTIDGNGHPSSEPMQHDEMLEDWWNENYTYFMDTTGDLAEAYQERLLIKKGDPAWVDAQAGSAQSYYGFQAKWDMNSGTATSADEGLDQYTRYYGTEKEAMLAINYEKYGDIILDEMGNNGYEHQTRWENDDTGDIFDSLEEAQENARDILFDYQEQDGATGSLWQEYTLASKRGFVGSDATNYRLDTYNIDDFQARAGDPGEDYGSLPDKHWSELNSESPDVELGVSNGYTYNNDFENTRVLAWTRAFDWNGDKTILEELQSDWAQTWSKDNASTKAVMKKLGLEEFDKEVISTFVQSVRKDYTFKQGVARRADEALREFSVSRASRAVDIIEKAKVEIDGLDFSDLQLKQNDSAPKVDLNRYVREAQRNMNGALDTAAQDFIDTVLTANGKELDDFSVIEFRKWMKGRIKDNKELNANPDLPRVYEEPKWMTDLIGNDDNQVTKALLDDVMNDTTPFGFVGMAMKKKLAIKNKDSANVKLSQAQQEFRKFGNALDVTPKPPMGETSSYVRTTLLDQLTKAIDNDKKEFGWWDAKVQNERWHEPVSIEINSINKDTDTIDYIVNYTDRDGNTTQMNMERSDLVRRTSDRQMSDIDLELERLDGSSTADGDMFNAVDEGHTNMFVFANKVKTGTVFDSQYDQVMVNVMNKLLNSKKTGINMVKKLHKGTDELYWSLEITKEVKDLIIGQKHQLYK